MLSHEINSYVNQVMESLRTGGAYFEEGEEKVRNSFAKYLTTEYNKEIMSLSLKIEVEKSRGLTGSDSKQRYETEYRYMKQRFMTRVEALSKSRAQISE